MQWVWSSGWGMGRKLCSHINPHWCCMLWQPNLQVLYSDLYNRNEARVTNSCSSVPCNTAQLHTLSLCWIFLFQWPVSNCPSHTDSKENIWKMMVAIIRQNFTAYFPHSTPHTHQVKVVFLPFVTHTQDTELRVWQASLYPASDLMCGGWPSTSIYSGWFPCSLATLLGGL